MLGLKRNGLSQNVNRINLMIILNHRYWNLRSAKPQLVWDCLTVLMDRDLIKNVRIEEEWFITKCE